MGYVLISVIFEIAFRKLLEGGLQQIINNPNLSLHALEFLYLLSTYTKIAHRLEVGDYEKIFSTILQFTDAKKVQIYRY